MGRLILTTARPSPASISFARAKKAVEDMKHEDNPDVRVVRHVDRPVLGQEQPKLVSLPIADDRNQNQAFGAWRDEFGNEPE